MLLPPACPLYLAALSVDPVIVHVSCLDEALELVDISEEVYTCAPCPMQ